MLLSFPEGSWIICFIFRESVCRLRVKAQAKTDSDSRSLAERMPALINSTAVDGISRLSEKKSLSGVLKGVLQSLDSIDAGSFDNEGDRIGAVVAAYALVARLETPWEFLARTGMGQVRTRSVNSYAQAAFFYFYA